MTQVESSFCAAWRRHFLSLAVALCAGTVSAAQPVKLGYAETVIGGQVLLVDEACQVYGFGTGYVLYLTNPRGTTIGKGCAMGNALLSNFGMIVVQWGASPVQGAASYPLDGFTWTARGLAVMTPVLKARQEALARIDEQSALRAREEAENLAMVVAFNSADIQKPYLGVVQATGYPPTILITPRQCSMFLIEPDPSGKYSGAMVQHDAGRAILGLSSDGTRIVDRGCALAHKDGSITVRLSTDDPGRPVRFNVEKIRWEPRAQEWIEVGSPKLTEWEAKP